VVLGKSKGKEVGGVLENFSILERWNEGPKKTPAEWKGGARGLNAPSMVSSCRDREVQRKASTFGKGRRRIIVHGRFLVKGKGGV